MEHAEAVKLIKDYGFAVLKHQNNWLGEAYEALLRALLATPAPLATPTDKQDAVVSKVREIVDWIVGMSTDAPVANMARRALELLDAAPPAPPSDKQEAVVYAVSDEAAMQWVERHDLENIIRDPGTARCAIDDARSLHLIDAPLATPSDKQEATPRLLVGVCPPELRAESIASDKQEIAELRERIAELERDIALMQKLR